MNIEVIKRTKGRIPRAFLKAWSKAVFQELERTLPAKAKTQIKTSQTVRVVFLDAAEIRRLNVRYRGVDHATDVLSFSADESGVLGELALCLSVIRKQAAEHNLSIQEELGYMVLHGILHLLGFEHEVSESAARRMFKIQDAVFDKLIAKKRSLASRH